MIRILNSLKNVEAWWILINPCSYQRLCRICNMKITACNHFTYSETVRHTSKATNIAFGTNVQLFHVSPQSEGYARAQCVCERHFFCQFWETPRNKTAKLPKCINRRFIRSSYVGGNERLRVVAVKRGSGTWTVKLYKDNFLRFVFQKVVVNF